MFKIRVSKTALIALALLGIAIMVGCTWMYCNRSAKLNSMKAEIAKKEDLLANSQRTAKRLEVMQQEYNLNQAKLNMLEKGVSSKAYVPTLLRQLQDLGKSSNLRVVGVRPKPAVPQPVQAANSSDPKIKEPVAKPDPYDKLELDIEVNGKYWDVVKFINNITSFPKIVAVNNIQINPIDDTKLAGSPMLAVKISATAFIIKDQQYQKEPGEINIATQDSART